MDEKVNIQNLVDKYINNTISAQELKVFLSLIADSSNELLIFSMLKKEWESTSRVTMRTPLSWEELYYKLQQKKSAQRRSLPLKMKQRAGLFKIAAAVIILLMSGVIISYFISKKQLPKRAIAQNIIVPGGNNAVLTLANGQQIILNKTNNGTIAQQRGALITKTQNGQIMYVAATANNATTSKEPSINTISTPRGGQYQVELPDGTKVWLNAMSSLTFPTAFSGKERKVQLTGEGYFEVTKNKKMPFIVESGIQQVEVLGTHFDINAYKDEKEIKTTLLEGSVRVSAGNNHVVIKPGEQAHFSGKDISVSEVDTDETIDWKNGYIQFNDENIYAIMRKISRWYNVDIRYEGKINNIAYGGTVSRSADISDVLKALEATGTVHFKIDKRRISVMP